jgi:hypothetical protein
MNLSIVALGLAGLYCLARAATDLRDRRFIWAGLGLGCAALLLLTPIRSEVIKYDLPRTASN